MFGIRKRRSASLLLFPAAHASVQNLITLVILDGSVRFTYRFVVLFSTLEIASLPLFLPFLTCLILDLPSMFLQLRTEQQSQETNMAHGTRQKSSSTHE